MHTSDRGLLMLMRHEAVVLSAYEDAVGVWTIGVGHTAAAGEPRPAPGMKMTLAEALALLRKDLLRFEAGVARAVTVPLEQHEWDALVSFHFNTGAIARATLTKRLNAGDRAGAAAGFMSWTRGGGRVLPGLVRRRQEERALFEHGDYGDTSKVQVYDRFPGASRLVPTAGLLSAPSAPHVPASPPILRQGDEGDAVASWQERLARQGLYTMRVDGDFGAATYKATRAFQRTLGLVPDGIVGPRTYAAMDSVERQ